MILRGVLFVTFVFVLISVPTGVHAAEWYVDGLVVQSGNGTSWKTAFKTIQDGIDAADHKDTVIVAEGTYVENTHFKGKNIMLRSTEPLNSKIVENTIIDGKKAGSVVTFFGTENTGCVLSGFTIQNGKAQSGGGILGHGALAMIRNNTITGNSASGDGGGLHECVGTIQNNTISTNQASVFGGGLYGCHGTIQKNRISGNWARRRGGGLFTCDGAIENNEITANSTQGNGGGLYGCDGKGAKDRVTMLPESLKAPLQDT